MFVDYMIPMARAKPTNGMEVSIRLKVTKDIATSIFRDGKFCGVTHEDVVSWMPKNRKDECSCNKLRWNRGSRKSGKCTKCGILWKKPKKKIDKQA